MTTDATDEHARDARRERYASVKQPAQGADNVGVDTSIFRTARQRAQLSKTQLAELTKLSPRIVAAIDEGRLERLPGGLYARSFVRTYGEAVGIDPATLAALVEALPAPEVEIAAVAAARQHAPLSDLADQTTRRRAAAIVDVVLVGVVSALGVLACSLLAGLGVPDLAEGLVAMVALAVPILITYLGLLGATGVGTLGARLFEVDFLPPIEGALDGNMLLQRTIDHLAAELRALLPGRLRSSVPA